MRTTALKMIAVLGVLAGGLVLSPAVGAADPLGDVCSGVTDSAICKDSAAGTETPQSVVKTVINALLYIVGFLSVIMIIVGGLRYVMSAGNSSAVTGAKNTILYAVVGLVVAFMAYAIVNWVLDVL